ncbi:sigma-70 family RNA polymerase sigma factor [Rhizobacter sp. J219]|jgi:RNA polymerase sigma-70 factor (ECF subfamily)|uniref:RNA polymerase sigma factor n=1 Tax=Rhizobacter sp. J219 TaxID=2898430 RepID=UPI002151088C|nr:sigma-70 family RNA polymerase sigma factor [Rhizobacter sp. J219]MCR5881704.1 sigma-70 family RNA polymerase sigma factor [Rhizobacter sp. J219]
MPSTARQPLHDLPPPPTERPASARVFTLPTRSSPDAATQQANARLVRLIKDVATLDRAAFRELYDATSAYLMGVAYTVVGQRELAEEVLQDAYVKVWHHAESYDPRLAAPMTWLIHIVRNRAIDVRRARQQEVASMVPLSEEQQAHLADTVGDASIDPLHLLQRHAVEMNIQACLHSLSAEQRQAVALVIYRGMAHAEIAKLANVPLGTAKAWVRRGLARLAECVGAVS